MPKTVIVSKYVLHMQAHYEVFTRALESHPYRCLRQGANWPEHVHTLPPSRHPQTTPNTAKHLIKGQKIEEV